jgi:hypothetical protein
VKGDRRARRWPWLVLSGLWVVRLLVVLPAGAWFVSGTLAASEGGRTPSVAVLGVVGGLSQWSGEDNMNQVLPLLCADRSRDLLDQLRALRTRLKDKGADLEEANTRESITSGGATVQTDVRARVALYQGNQFSGFFQGDWSTWTFQLVQEHGLTHEWKVCTAALHDPFT